jgi:hypothetical protein
MFLAYPLEALAGIRAIVDNYLENALALMIR